MKFRPSLIVATMLIIHTAGALHAEIVTTDHMTVADGRVQSSGVLGQELITDAEDIATFRSGGSNISDGLYEFDLSSVPDDAELISAEVLFRTAAAITNTNTTAPVEFYGFTGDGMLELTDESAAATLVASIDFTTSVGNDEDVAAPLSNLSIIESVLTDGNSDDFFALRSETMNFVTFRVDSLESTDPNAMAATLRLTYETATVPEPSSFLLMGMTIVGLVLRRRSR